MVFLKFGIQNYTIKELNPTNRKEIKAAQKLRHKIFCEELGWINSSENRKEYDKYDKYSTFFGIFNSHGKLVGFVRIVSKSPYGFMFQNEFRETVDFRKLKGVNFRKIIEISRLTVDPSIRGLKIGDYKIIYYFFKIIYKWSRVHKKRYWIFCITEDFFSIIQELLPVSIKIIGNSKEYRRGIISLSAIIDRKKFDEELKSRNLKLFKFFQ